MSTALRFRLLQAALIAAPLGFGVAGCESMDKLNPFAEKRTPLPGERKALFPEGVPGVEFGAAPTQPTNSNIPISPSVGEQQPGDNPPPQSQSQASSQPARAPAAAPAKSSRTKGSDSGDAWSGTR